MARKPPIDNSVNFSGQVASANTFGDNATVTTTIVIYQIGGLARSGQRIPGNPYVGMRSFSETESARFFGREKLVEQLWERFAAVSRGTCRFLAILGASGSGKSSVARAGLMAELDRRPLPGREQRLAIFTPGAHPLEALAGLMARVVTNDPAPTEKQAEFLRVLNSPGEGGVNDGLRRIAGSADRAREPLAIVIDQFDEIFSACDSPTERKIFIDTLLDAASEKGGGISLIVTMRSDYLGEAQTHGALNTVITDAERHYMLPAMSEDGLRRAIVQPAKASEPLHPIDDEAVVSQLISGTLRRDGALPLLQYALQQIWGGLAASGRSAEQTLLDLDGVGGALRSKAELIYQGLDETQKAIAKRAFVSMVKFSADLAPMRQRVVLRRLVADDVKVDDALERQAMLDVIQKFAAQDTRLVTLGLDENGDQAIEVTHEALFEYWPTLKGWLNEGKDDIRLHLRAAEAAELWKKGDGPLWVRPNLDRLRTLATKPVAQGFSPVEREFFNASVTAHRLRQLAGLGAAVAVLSLTAFSAWEWRAAEDAIGLASDATNNMSVNLVRNLIGVDNGANIRSDLGSIVRSVEERLSPRADSNGKFSEFWTLMIEAQESKDKRNYKSYSKNVKLARELSEPMTINYPKNLEWQRNLAMALMEDPLIRSDGRSLYTLGRLKEIETANSINQNNVDNSSRGGRYGDSEFSYRQDLVTSLVALAEYHDYLEKTSGDYRDIKALKAPNYYASALQQLELLIKKYPTSKTLLLNKSYVSYNYARFENLYRNDLAEEHYLKSTKLLQSLRKSDMNNLELTRRLSFVLNDLSGMYLANKYFAEPGGRCNNAAAAKTAIERALETSALALSLEPKDLDKDQALKWAPTSAEILRQRAKVELADKNIKAARQHIQGALNKMEGLSAATSSPDYQASRYLNLDMLAQVELTSGNLPAARQASREAIRIAESQASQNGDVGQTAKVNLSLFWKRLSDIESSDGRWVEATDAIQKAVKLRESLKSRESVRLRYLTDARQEITDKRKFQPLSGCPR